MIFVKGCARSGTLFAATYLKRLGLAIGHERLEADGVVAWQFTPIKFPFEGNIVAHQVRHPLRVIESAMTMRGKSRDMMDGFIDLGEGLRVVQMMRYWVLWNELAEETSQFTYRVEDQMHVLAVAVGKKPLKELPPTNTNTRRRKKEYVVPKFTFADLKGFDEEWCARIKKLAKKYGYKI